MKPEIQSRGAIKSIDRQNNYVETEEGVLLQPRNQEEIVYIEGGDRYTRVEDIDGPKIDGNLLEPGRDFEELVNECLNHRLEQAGRNLGKLYEEDCKKTERQEENYAKVAALD